MKKYILKIEGQVSDANGHLYDRVTVRRFDMTRERRPFAILWGDGLDWFLCGDSKKALEMMRKDGSVVVSRTVINEYKQTVSLG